MSFTYQSYSWSLGTTSFRMSNFHRKVEEQLTLLADFWKEIDEDNWDTKTQTKYYDYIFGKGFVTGNIMNDAAKKAKTARQKTSGLVDIGLIYKNRHLTEVGKKLLDFVNLKDFSSDNQFQIPKDSFLYLNQLIKTTNIISGNPVRPYLVFGKVMSSCGYELTDEEFTYLLPLCIDSETTESIIDGILKKRSGLISVDDIIINTVLKRYNYPMALNYFINNEKTPNIIMEIGMNRDGNSHDKIYVSLYNSLRSIYIEHNDNSIDELLESVKKLKDKVRTLWKKLLFGDKRNPKCLEDLEINPFSNVNDEIEFDTEFFKRLHLYKIRTNLSDYKDLNRRYLLITDSIIFKDSKVKFTPIFENFFISGAEKIFDDAFTRCDLLNKSTTLSDINPCLIFNEKQIIDTFNIKNNAQVSNIDEVYESINDKRYTKFRELIDLTFTDDIILSMLDDFETRNNDKNIIKIAGGEADVPTVFEYIIGIIWYKLSDYQGKILDYMNLSLDTNLFPRTHAGGGQSDIVYKYPKTEYYPEHSLLIECTLMEGTTQRHGEMEPVSRHLANYIIDEQKNSYCTFVTNKLHASVISDFRMRKNQPYYRNETEYTDGMKIIPLQVNDLKNLILNNTKYKDIYMLFDNAFNDSSIQSPVEWYHQKIENKISTIN